MRMTLSEQVFGRITLAVEGNFISTSEVGTIRRDTNSTDSPYELDWPESLQLSIVSRSTSPVVFKFAGITTLHPRRVEAEGVLWLSAVGENSTGFQIPLLMGTFDAFVFVSLSRRSSLTRLMGSRPYPRATEVPLPTLPPSSKHSRIPPPTTSRNSPPPLLETPFGTLEFTARFVSGMSEQHSNIIADHPLEVQQAFLVSRACRAKKSVEGSAISPMHLSTLLDGVRREGGVDSSRSSFEVGSGGSQWDVIQGELNALADVRSASPSSKRFGGIKSSVLEFSSSRFWECSLIDFCCRFMGVRSLFLAVHPSMPLIVCLYSELRVDLENRRRRRSCDEREIRRSLDMSTTYSYCYCYTTSHQYSPVRD